MVLKADFLNRNELADELIAAGKNLAEKNLLPATSGNLSQKISSDRILITLSGKDKAKLKEDDFIEIDFQAKPINSDNKASAEALLHTQLYAFNPEIKAVLHAHSSNSVVLSKIIGANKELRLSNYELLKALSGVEDHNHKEILPIFRNSQNIKLLAAEVNDFMQVCPELHAYLIEGHGIYIWGTSVEEALKHMEALDALMACELELMKLEK